ncbi:MAG: 50S ribosomal protein L15 [Candidatus Yanofskybacteria bacterium RIFCSPHIGHO2_01_FULL_44_17]|uniref:Large ribosomal subunit protein uL15 n=1 Tax=Candidatus Yanofskybacteria bacterium RIFCSPHIGHO2_01_FULL_44_17 TaxID=1802668 RepID=A0A1F8ESP6_9BACT|nr:MAG: 50S ribosomal protein L15 [Candidatus Yanofskybacteria bacterium RIFCSPHIGHO2_01_FULL_44_17]
MQLNQLKPTIKGKKRKRVGRGGKRGTFSGHGSKGQKARAGTRIRPGFRGGDNPIWKLFPKQRGATKKVDIKHKAFQVRYKKPAVVSLSYLSSTFKDGDKISPRELIRRGLVSDDKNGVKILSGGEISKKLNFSGLKFSKSAQEKILKAGGSIK